MKEMKIKVDDNTYISVEKFVWRDDKHKNHEEFVVGLVDSKNNWFQDLALVRKSESENPAAEILVWSDSEQEDYTHKFVVNKFEEVL